MSLDYTPPLDDITAVLEQFGLPGIAALADFAHVDAETIPDVLAEAGRFFAETVAPLNVVGDRVGSAHDPETHTVTTPPGFKEAYAQYVEAGWGAVTSSPEYGGGGFPFLVGVVFEEIMSTANLSFGMCPLLSQGATRLLEAHASDDLKAVYMPRMISGEWTGTMCLTEPDAGSDLGVIRTKAEPQADGSYRLSGTKIFITFGEHDLTDQIVHLVLARTPDAPVGTKGISCFVVPKFLVEADGTLGARNDVACLSIEHKMGTNASPTCVLSFGEEGAGATGWLVGELNAGMVAMFTMMNHARIGVAAEGLALAERAWQQARAYAAERLQGRASGTPKGERAPIVEHPDVRRMLLTMESEIQAMRRLIYATAASIDLAEHADDAETRREHEERAALLTPLAKAWSTDTGFEVTSLGVQIHGGMGYVEETGAAQHLRDARIAMIYEGTNGIQAMDLVGRKLGMRGGGVVADHFARIRSDLTAVGDGPLAASRDALAAALAAAEEATAYLAGVTSVDDALAGATPYLHLLSMLTAGHLMLQSAVLAAGTDREAGQQRTTRFFCEQLVPTGTALVPSITAGADALAFV